MKLAIISYCDDYDSNRLLEEAKYLNIKTSLIKLCDLTIDNNFDIFINKLNKYDCLLRTSCKVPKESRNLPIIFRDAILTFEPQLASKFINGASYLMDPVFSKLHQFLRFKKSGIPIPPTYYRMPIDQFKFPYVIKGLVGSLGRQVHLITDEKTLNNNIKKYNDADYLIQNLIEPWISYRTYVLGNSVVGIVKKIAGKNFLTNISNETIVEVQNINDFPDLVELSLKVSKICKCDYAGIDIMYDYKKNPYVLELNRAAGFHSIERHKTINIAQKILEFIQIKYQTQ